MVAIAHEPEAIRLLAGIVDALPEQRERALADARQYLLAIRSDAAAPKMGRPCTLSSDQLRAMAAMAAEGRSQHGIARDLGISRDLVAHHLGSRHGCVSKVMRYVMQEGASSHGR